VLILFQTEEENSGQTKFTLKCEKRGKSKKEVEK